MVVGLYHRGGIVLRDAGGLPLSDLTIRRFEMLVLCHSRIGEWIITGTRGRRFGVNDFTLSVVATIPKDMPPTTSLLDNATYWE